MANDENDKMEETPSTPTNGEVKQEKPLHE